jgi:hypothetical protein
LMSATAAVACALATGTGASAATIAVRGDTAVFQAARGEANDLQIGISPRLSRCRVDVDVDADVDVARLCVADAGAPLTVGTGCEQLNPNLALCPEETWDPRIGRPVLVLGGDRDDSLYEESEMREEVTLRGGSGDDALLSGAAIGKSPSLYGGYGDDTVLRVQQQRREPAHARRSGR